VHHQRVTFENLADWLEGRLQGEALKNVEAHLTTGCPRCERDLAWLRRFGQAARNLRTIPIAYPPAALVAQARQGFRARPGFVPAARRRATWRPWRPALALATTVVLLLALLMAWQPGIVQHAVVLASAEGIVQVRSGDAAWQEASQGYRLVQGTQVRVSDGAAVVELFDGSRVQLEMGAEVELSVLRSSVLGKTHHIIITQRIGYVIYDVVASDNRRSAFTVSAPAASVAAKGNAFAVDVQDAGPRHGGTTTRVVVLEGQVEVTHDRAELLLTDREGLLISSQGQLVLLPTLAIPSLARPTATLTSPTATVTPLAAPTSIGAYPVASPTRISATHTRVPPSVTPTSTSTQAPKPAPSRTPEPYQFPDPTEWMYTVTPITRLPLLPSVTPTCWMTTTCWPTTPEVPPEVQTAIPKIETIVSQITPPPQEWPTSMPEMPPEVQTAIPKIETIVSQITPPVPGSMPPWPKP
jgi:ferric-dicitrate binding protein FerR (iron transport regulator)